MVAKMLDAETRPSPSLTETGSLITPSFPASPRDRRRPGRLHADNPGLIALLRTPFDLVDRVGVSRGIIIGLALAVPTWAILAGLSYAIYAAVFQ